MKSVYIELDELKKQKTILKGLAMDETLRFDKCMKIREENKNIKKKLSFYEGFIHANEKLKKLA